jgi:seryl-tRNA synthetase
MRNDAKQETALQALNAERKKLSKEIGGMRSRGQDSLQLENRVRKIGEEIARLNEDVNLVDGQQKEMLLEIPNLPHLKVPIGKDASANPVVRSWGAKPNLDSPLDHVTIGTNLKLFDLERAAKAEWERFHLVLPAPGARLERALIQFMLDLHTREHGYEEMSPPFLVRRECMIGTSQLPKFEADMYGLENSQLFLAPTAEVPVTNFHREEILSADELPKKYVAYTPCFRAEGGFGRS